MRKTPRVAEHVSDLPEVFSNHVAWPGVHSWVKISHTGNAAMLYVIYDLIHDNCSVRGSIHLLATITSPMWLTPQKLDRSTGPHQQQQRKTLEGVLHVSHLPRLNEIQALEWRTFCRVGLQNSGPSSYGIPWG